MVKRGLIFVLAVLLVLPVWVYSRPMWSSVAVTIDRPFIFLVRDTEMGAVLFAGRVLHITART